MIVEKAHFLFSFEIEHKRAHKLRAPMNILRWSSDGNTSNYSLYKYFVLSTNRTFNTQRNSRSLNQRQLPNLQDAVSYSYFRTSFS